MYICVGPRTVPYLLQKPYHVMYHTVVVLYHTVVVRYHTVVVMVTVIADVLNSEVLIP